jgi:hypothetical protein
MCARAKARKNGSAQTHRPGRRRWRRRREGRGAARSLCGERARRCLLAAAGRRACGRPAPRRATGCASAPAPSPPWAIAMRALGPGGTPACGLPAAGVRCARWALYAGRGWARQGSSWRCPGSHRAAQLGPASLGLRTQALHEHLMRSIYVAVALWRPSAPPLSTEDKSKCNKIQLEPGIQNKR